MTSRRLLVVGGGAAGYFAAITAKEFNPSVTVILVEAGNPLRKVLISGGGRCNVTHHCFDPEKLIKAYPRGAKELRSVFARFQPKDTVEWFESRGVKLKTEADGRIFPVSDLSQSIVNCLEKERIRLQIELRKQTKLLSIVKDREGFLCRFKNSEKGEIFNNVIIASGSAPEGYNLAKSLGHTITPCVPSLFTFAVSDSRLEGIAGLSVVDASLRLTVGEKIFNERGALLITHWGLSGPAIIRLSSWAARELAGSSYQAELCVNWLGILGVEEASQALQKIQIQNPKKMATNFPAFSLPKRLWEKLVEASSISCEVKWSEITRVQRTHLLEQLTNSKFQVSGKGVFKEEFVTCGGVKLSEIDFRRMESKLNPGLFFAGEILDIDGITGGFNFQSAWSTGWIAGNSLSCGALQTI